MRNAEETLNLLLIAIDHRRNYLRRKLRKIEDSEKRFVRGRARERLRLKYSGRVSMLSELSVVEWLINEIRNDRLHPDEIYNENDDTDEDLT